MHFVYLFILCATASSAYASEYTPASSRINSEKPLTKTQTEAYEALHRFKALPRHELIFIAWSLQNQITIPGDFLQGWYKKIQKTDSFLENRTEAQSENFLLFTGHSPFYGQEESCLASDVARADQKETDNKKEEDDFEVISSDDVTNSNQ